MKLRGTLLLSLFLLAAAPPASLHAGHNALCAYSQPPVKTVIIKHPMANDHSAFFSGGKLFMFEVYKASEADMKIILASFLKSKDVENCSAGPVAGDYASVNLVLKNSRDKAWFIDQFKKAGLNTIKINQADVTSVDKI